MNLPWWVWLLLALYAAGGIYTCAAFLTMKPIGLLPEEGEEPPEPDPAWVKAVRLPVALVLAFLLWPGLVWEELRNYYRH